MWWNFIFTIFWANFLHLKRLQCNLGKCLWKTEPNESHKQCKVCIPDWMVQLHSTIISSSLNCKSLIVQVYWLLKQANIERLKNVWMLCNWSVQGSLKKHVDICHNFFFRCNITLRFGTHIYTTNHVHFKLKFSNLTRYFRKYSTIC